MEIICDIINSMVKKTYKSWVKYELAIESTPSRASKVLQIMESMSSVRRTAIISSWNEARGFEPTVKPLDVDKDADELTECEL